MTKRKTPPNTDGASPNKVSVSAKRPRKPKNPYESALYIIFFGFKDFTEERR